uniref:Uncharacterized protein n=1 Tax=Oryza brachyantha TaxID=4533 RepID=J3KYD2_ORYBR
MPSTQPSTRGRAYISIVEADDGSGNDVSDKAPKEQHTNNKSKTNLPDLQRVINEVQTHAIIKNKKHLGQRHVLETKAIVVHSFLSEVLRPYEEQVQA